MTDTYNGAKWYHLGRIPYDAFSFLAENTKIEINTCYNSNSIANTQQALYTILFKTSAGVTQIGDNQSNTTPIKAIVTVLF